MKKSLVFILLSLTFGCSDDTTERPSSDMGVDVSDDAGDTGRSDSCGTAQTQQASIGRWSITVNEDGRWEVQSDSINGVETQFLGVAGCETPIARAFTGTPFQNRQVGAFQIRLEGDGAQTEWRSATLGVPELAEANGELRLAFKFEDDSNGALVFSERDGYLQIQLEADGFDGGELNQDCRGGDEPESFFGLGTQVTGMDLRGRTYPLWTQEQGNGKPEDGGVFPINNVPEAAYAPMGVWHSTRGWAAVVTHDGYSEIDLCNTAETTVSLRSYPFLPGFVLIDGDLPRDRIEGITSFTGRLGDVPTGTPDWVYGLWLDAIGGPWRVDEVAAALRDNDVPSSAIWTEDWIGGGPTAFGYRLSYAWEWDEDEYPGLPAQIDQLQANGFAFLAYFNSFVPEPTRMFTEGTDGGYLIKDESGTVMAFIDPGTRQASLIDLTNADAVNWLGEYQTTAVKAVGVDGWMADFSEWLPVEAVMDNGMTGWEYHNVYPLEWQRVNAKHLSDAAPNFGGVFFPRSGWASVNGGASGTAPVMWGGDQDTDWTYDDGFPTTIPLTAHAGMAGVAIMGTDIAGYNSVGAPNTTKELWYRWVAMSAFHPLMRTHHGGDECDNWHFDRDAESTEHLRRYSSIHTLLYPYFKELQAEAEQTGMPMIRHPYLVAPTSRAMWTGDQYEFFLGDDILVAPVMTESTTTRSVQAPVGGEFLPLFGGDVTWERVNFEVSTDVAAPVGEIPVFVRSGTVLQLLGEVVPSFYGNWTTQNIDYRYALYGTTIELGSGRGDVVLADRLDAWDVQNTRIGGANVGECADEAHTNCVNGQVVRVALTGATEVEVGNARIEMAPNSGAAVVEVGLGVDAWLGLDQATTFQENPDAPSWCENAPD